MVKLTVILTMTIFLVLWGQSAPANVNWNIRTLPSTERVEYTSIAMDGAGNAHICYSLGLPNIDLKYAVFNGSTWDVSTIDSSGYVGRYVELVLDAGERPHVAYYDETNGDLKYAAFDGSAWDIQTVDSTGDVGSFISLALDVIGNPHISYCDNTNGYLKYASSNGTSWNIQTVDSTGVIVQWTSLALNAGGEPHISYCDTTNSHLKYARWNGTGWDIEIVDSSGKPGSGICTSLALDSAGNPHISYFGFWGQDGTIPCTLTYAVWNGSGWDITMLDSHTYTGIDTCLVLDANDKPQISYFGGWGSDGLIPCQLSHMLADGTIITVDSPYGTERSRVSLSLDPDGNANISYPAIDWPNFYLNYAYAFPGPMPVNIDIKPGSCPNPLNMRSKGVLPAAILGSQDFDVSDIDPASIELAGIGAIRSSLEDAAGPVVNSNGCECAKVSPDGIDDLTVKFPMVSLVDQLIDAPGDLAQDDVLTLNLTAKLLDGRAIEGSDCVVLVGNVSRWLLAKDSDANKDGRIDFLDIAEMAKYWLERDTR